MESKVVIKSVGRGSRIKISLVLNYFSEELVNLAK